MNTDPRQDKEQMQELLRLYRKLQKGQGGVFLEEDAFEKIIDYFDEQEDLGRAIEAADIALEYFPFSSILLIKKADLLLATRRYEEALDLLEKAEAFGAADIDLFILKTDAYLAMDMQEKAVALLEKAIQRFDGQDKTELLFELADVYDDYEEFDKVFDCLLMILEEDPNNEEALYKICFWTDFTGRNEECIRLHLKIIEDYPYNELAWFNLAAAYQGLKLYEKSIDAYQYAIAIDEKFDFAYRNMADAYIRMRQYKEAIEALNRVNELSKPESVIYEALGHCYDRLRNYGQARFHYRKASHLNPDDSKIFYKIACTYYNEERWQNAVKSLDTALRIHKQHAEYNLLMGECKWHLNDFKEAVQYLSAAVRMRPKNIAGWEALVKCLHAAGYTAEARQQAVAAEEITGKNIFVYYQSALLFLLNKPKEAMLYLEKALSVSPKGIKRFIDFNPSILQNMQVVDIIAKYKRAHLL